MWSPDIMSVVVGLILGSVVFWILATIRVKKLKAALHQEEVSLSEQLESTRIEKSRAEERSRLLDEHFRQMGTDLAAERERVMELRSALSRSQAENAHLVEKLQTQKQELEDLYKKMTEQFENIAHQILLDSSQQVKQRHQEELSLILNPFREKIESFERKVDDTHKENIRENQSLKEQIASLQRINQSIGEEAKNLTTALKGQSKVQGNWGEVILERILEKSGLVRGREYVIQSNMTGEEGRRLQPDVVIHLPEGRHLVIDSKVSLSAYDRYCSVEAEEDRGIALKEHLDSVRRHIKELGAKNYQNLYQIRSPDFVFLFIPIEPAFSLAIQADNDLYNDAFERNIVLISTSTLWASLRIIANLWRQESQSRNAAEIAKRGGELYDKFVGFVEDMVDLGDKMQAAERSYQGAISKLHTGKGNLIKRAQEMKVLGVKAAKSLPKDLIEKTEDDDLPLIGGNGGDANP